MSNTIKVYGIIAPSDYDWMRHGFLSPLAATFPVTISEALQNADTTKDLTLLIDSPGGFIDSGRTMITMIDDWCQKNGRKCHVKVGGLAASMAAVMAIAFSGTVTAHECSIVMFHAAKASLVESATSEELKDAATSLEIFNKYAAKMIARRAKITQEKAAQMIAGRKESFFGADELLQAGLIDSVTSSALPESVTQPSSADILAFSKTLSAGKDAGGLLAAVALSAFDKLNKKGTNMEEKPAEPTPAEPVDPAPVESTPAEPVDPAPVESTPAAPAPAEPAPSEPIAPAIDYAQQLDSLRQALAQAQAAEQAATQRARAAENELKAIRAQKVKATMAPADESASKNAVNPAIAWREHVHACAGNTARAKETRPDLFEALLKHY